MPLYDFPKLDEGPLSVDLHRSQRCLCDGNFAARHVAGNESQSGLSAFVTYSYSVCCELKSGFVVSGVATGQLFSTSGL